MKFVNLGPFFLSVFLLASGTTVVFACRAAPPSPSKMIDGADEIVRVEAEKYIVEPTGDIRVLAEPSDAAISFKVKETLKGDLKSSDIVLNGYLSDTDAFNQREAPYTYGRSGGGTCSAFEYKRGAEFLLFLKKIDGKYTIRWYALAPTNEQLRSVDDEWITWVRDYLKKPKS